MKDGESLGTALGSNSELPHCCRESCNFTFTEREEPPRDVFQQEFAIRMGRTFFGSIACWSYVHFRNVGGDFLRFRQRSNPLIIVELL